MHTPSITVVVCTYNRANEIVECLNSLCRQTYHNFDILIVDDGSDDGTEAIVESFFATKSNIDWRLVKHAFNKGLYAARNTGVKEAIGDIVAFVDTDCIADREWLSHLVTGFHDESITIVGGYVEDFYDGRYIQLATKGIYACHRATPGPLRYIVGTNMAGRKTFLLENPLDENERYGNDDREWCETARRAGFSVWYVPKAKVLHKHRQTLPSLIHQQYLQGVSSTKFRIKYGLFPLSCRAACLFVFLLSLLLYVILPFFYYPLWLSLIAFSSIVLIRDLRSKEKSLAAILITFPVTLLASVAHSGGCIVGLFFCSKRWLFNA